jgi:hypothetical protein
MVLLVSSTSTALRAEYEFEYVGSEGEAEEDEMSHLLVSSSTIGWRA